MRYLIDSNILLFCVGDPSLLTKKVTNILGDYGNRIYISSRCVEELIALQQSSKLNIKQWKTAEDIIRFITDETNIEIKYVAKEHLDTLARLPLLREHRDPVDRMIVAQAITEGMPMVSCDTLFPKYVKHGLKLVSNPK
jgi:PIN domain nuclease of toxin-antitoxin system